MTEDETAAESSPLAGGKLRLVYVAGIAFNVIALAIAAMSEEWLFAGTFALVIVYLCARYWMLANS